MINRFSGIQKDSNFENDKVRVNILIKKAKINQIREKRTNIFYALGAVTFVLVSGLVLAL